MRRSSKGTDSRSSRWPGTLRVVTMVLAFTVRLWAAPSVAVEGVALSVSDLDRSLAFYTNVLPFKIVSKSELAGAKEEKRFGVFGVRVRVARLKLGEEYLELRQFLAPEGRPVPVDSRSNDRWFQHVAIIVSDMEKAYALLRKNHVRYASSGPQRLPDWNQNAGGIQAFYFKDPDGHPLELLEFPEGKGDSKWHKPRHPDRVVEPRTRPSTILSPGTKVRAEDVFLGIDHTAIVVASTARSLKFYRDRLGLGVKGASENYGTEQEHLNNVEGAHLRITALRAGSGPGIEFLDYRAPKNGRPYPKGAHPNDLVFSQTLIKTSDAGRLCGARVEACSIRDPDGHGLLISPISPVEPYGMGLPVDKTHTFRLSLWHKKVPKLSSKSML